MYVTFNAQNVIFERIVETFSYLSHNNMIQLPLTLGNGYIQSYALSDKFVILLLDCTVKQSVEFILSSNSMFMVLEDASKNLEGIQIEIGGDKKPLNNLLCFENQKTKLFIPKNTYCRYWLVQIKLKNLQEHLKGAVIDFGRGFLLNTYRLKNIGEKLKQIVEKTNADEQYVQFQVLAQMYQFLAQMHIGNTDEELTTKHKPIDKEEPIGVYKAQQYIDQHLNALPTIKELAKFVGFSESKLKRNFKHTFGKSIHRYGQYKRMKKAQKILETKDYNISEIAYEVGYSNVSHFSNAFKKHFGQTPSQYLKNIK